MEEERCESQSQGCGRNHLRDGGDALDGGGGAAEGRPGESGTLCSGWRPQSLLSGERVRTDKSCFRLGRRRAGRERVGGGGRTQCSHVRSEADRGLWVSGASVHRLLCRCHQPVAAALLPRPCVEPVVLNGSRAPFAKCVPLASGFKTFDCELQRKMRFLGHPHAHVRECRCSRERSFTKQVLPLLL